MFKIILNLMVNRASKKRWQMEIGTYLLKKGTNYKIGQIIQEKKIDPNRSRVRVITGIYYDYLKNRVTYTTDKRVIKNHEKKG